MLCLYAVQFTCLHNMALNPYSYWFRPGRLEKNGRSNPGININFFRKSYIPFIGILAVDDKYEFTVHRSNTAGSSWTYHCKYRQTPKIKCQAKAIVVELEDKWILKHASDDHNCEPNRPRVISELLRTKMKDIVRKEPEKPVGLAVRKV